MTGKRKGQALVDAKKFYKLLLYEASGGNLGIKPKSEIVNNLATFGEKKGLLSEIIKLAIIEEKANESEEAPSGLEMIRRSLQNDDRETQRGRDSGRDAEDTGDEPDSGTSGSSETDVGSEV